MKRVIVVLILLDLSAAFDTIAHAFLYVICIEIMIKGWSGLGLTYPIDYNE